MENQFNSRYLSRDQLTGGTEEVIELVKQERIFGAVECDLFTDNPHFDEMCPIFRTCEVDVEDIGDHMKEFLEDQNCRTKTRKLLVAGKKAHKILVATPLLKWYIEKGIAVSNVTLIVEYDPQVITFFF